MLKIGTRLFAGAALLSVMACDDGAVDKSENAIRCRDICSQVAECLDYSDEREEECRDECKDRSTNDDFENQVEECQSCLDRDNSCSENGVDCATECASVVVLS